MSRRDRDAEIYTVEGPVSLPGFVLLVAFIAAAISLGVVIWG